MSLTSPASTPAWIAAPIATTSSGLTPLCGSFPNRSLTICWTFGNPRRAADEDDLVDLLGVDSGVRERLLRRADRPLQQLVDQLLELRPRELLRQVLRPGLRPR